MMKNMPRMTDLAIFGTLALILAAVATISGAAGAWLAAFAFPLFFACAIFGMHRSGRFTESRVPVEIRRDPRLERVSDDR